ncbi:MAG TPA: vitamin K epoxide reductase family protein [Candidatus Nanoarchaeia archaeon]|nr:vitamin K epoxide reductase family protein [Candidatus Nanoarchaeia archaeon]
MLIAVISFLGLLLSVYALYTEKKHAANHHYHPLCDIDTKTSCTKAFDSPYGKLLGIPNSLAGIVFYLVLIVLAFFNYNRYLFYLSLLSVLGSCYLAYILFAKLKIKCVVCISIYVVNLLLLVITYFQNF